MLRRLASRPQSRAFALAEVRRYCIQSHRSLDLPLDLAAEVPDPQLRELILDKAFETQSIYPTRTYYAIEGLAKFDDKHAVEAVRRQLKNSNQNEHSLCALLATTAPENATAILFDTAVAVERDSLYAAAGRALRRLPPTEVDERLTQGFTSAHWQERRVAVELVGWLPADRLAIPLATLFDAETDQKVRSAYFAACARRRDEATVYELFAEFRVCPTKQHWALLLSILRVGDPMLLLDHDDRLWIGQALSDMPYVYARHAEEVLEQRVAKLK